MTADIIVIGISSVFFFYALLCSGYNLLFAVASLFYKNFSVKGQISESSFLVLVPSYKEDEIILDSAKRNLKAIDYPVDKYKLVIIADQLKNETVDSLKNLGKNSDVHEVSFDKSTKVKSLNSAIRAYDDQGFDYIVVLDADNVVHPEFLSNVNRCISKGYLAIQGRRRAKNKNNSLSILDGLSEEINNSIFRKGGNVLGLSSPISGSGMAYQYQLFKEILESESALGGFDKMLQVRIIERRVKIRFCENAYVFDEKTDDQKAFKNQRKRWLNSHFSYFTRFAGNGLKGLFTLNLDLFNLAIFIHGLLPRSFNTLLIGLFLVIAMVTPDVRFLEFQNWAFIFVAFLLANLIAIPKEYLNMKLLKAIGSIPITFFNLFLALLKIKESNKSFIHTPHKKHSSNE